ncbi:MAG TPA: hypothetical protein VIK55_11520 [Paludibacter sp.]
MENLNQIAKDILSIFEIVCVISNEKELFFEEPEILLDKLTLAKQLISNIKLDTITDEIWDYGSYPDRDSKIIDLVNAKFDKLITWKPNTESILEMSNKLNEDLNNFYKRQICINREYDPFEQSVINSQYKEIGQRAYKLDSNLSDIMDGIFEKTENEKVEQGIISEQFTFKLNTKKTGHFAFLLMEMYKQNFFTPAKSENTISEVDVLFAFGELFKCDLVKPHFDFIDQNHISIYHSSDLNVFESSMPTTETTDYIAKPFPEYLLHLEKIKLADEIRKEFSTEKGKAIRLLLHVLENSKPPLVTIGYRQAKEVHIAMSDFFGRNIGKYQSVFDYKVDVKLDQKELENISVRLNHLLSKL